MPTVVLMGTLDTKGREYAFVRARLAAAGVTPLLVDFGVLGEPSIKPDIGSAEVAQAGGADFHNLRFGREGSDTRAAALAIMERGLIEVLRRLREEGRCDGVLGLAGSGGSSAISGAMRSLPLGVPKLLVSTMAASVDMGAYIGTRDICIMHSVTDIAGLNRVSRTILANAAHALVGMVRSAGWAEEPIDKPLVAITMFGITTPGVLRLVRRLEESGFETIVFHAVGSGGRSMEQMIEEGVIDGVIDYTVSELTDHLLGGIFDAGPDRLEAAGRRGIPQVVVPGAIEVLNFGARSTVPEKYDRPERRLIIHNPSVCAVRINQEEGAQLGKLLAAKVNAATGPTAVLLPLNGLDKYEAAPDGPYIDRHSDESLFDAIRSDLRQDIPLTEMDANINDPEFADRVFEAFMQLWRVYASPNPSPRLRHRLNR
jgi:uncharacterized protein (UPF0261 family)